LSGEEPPARIDRAYYEGSGYFESGSPGLRDPGSPFQRYRIREVRALCRPEPGERIVDLGCGWGTITFALAGAEREVVGVDFAQASVRFCRERLEKEPVPGLRFVRADAGDTGLPGKRWDLVVAADLVEHLYPEDTLRLYREARRLLRPGGRFVVWTPNPGHFLERLRVLGVLRPDPTHVDYTTMDRIVRELERVGFEVEVSRHVPSHLPILRTLERAAQGFVPLLRRRIAVVARVPGEEDRTEGTGAA